MYIHTKDELGASLEGRGGVLRCRHSTGSRGLRVVPKSCAYITRSRNGDNELLVFRGPDHKGKQIPKGTVESGESALQGLYREVSEESGLTEFEGVRHVATDTWVRDDRKLYLRNFYHLVVEESRDGWKHVVTDDGEEQGHTFRYSWEPLSRNPDLVMDLDDYLGDVRDLLGSGEKVDEPPATV